MGRLGYLRGSSAQPSLERVREYGMRSEKRRGSALRRGSDTTGVSTETFNKFFPDIDLDSKGPLAWKVEEEQGDDDDP
jgi:hypothetical protein